MQFSLFEKSLELSKRVVLEQAEKKINGQLASPRLPGSGRRGDVRLCVLEQTMSLTQRSSP